LGVCWSHAFFLVSEVDPPVAALPVAEPAPEASAVDLGGQSHCGAAVGIGASGGGSGSGDTRCTSVEAGGDAQVNTDGFGDIGMQFQDSPVNPPITAVHNSNEGDNNSNNTIVGDSNVIITSTSGSRSTSDTRRGVTPGNRVAFSPGPATIS
jgi:hypothetical protein